MSQDGVVEKNLDERRQSIVEQTYSLPFKNNIPKYDALAFMKGVREYEKEGANAVTLQLDAYFNRNADASDVISALKLNKTLSDEAVLLFKMANEKGKEVVSWEDLSGLCKDAMIDTYLMNQYYLSERNIKELLRNIALAEVNGVKLINTNSKERGSVSSYNVRDGIGFEEYCISLLQANGYDNVQKTPVIGDHGVDITAEKDYVSYAIQCKYYSSPVGNGAIQEAYSGKMIYKKDIAVVMTNNEFTPQAISDANALGVKLWDGKVLDSFKKAMHK
jgi:HJR/Mrr/RecB family endonuclease